MPTLLIDDRRVEALPGESLLQAARRVDIDIPTLCHHPSVEDSGACRLCVVEITRPGWDGWRKLVTSCLYPAEEGLQVHTGSERVRTSRREVLDLLLARCPDAPLIQRLAREHGLSQSSYPRRAEADDCILCGLCTRACEAVGAHAITTAQRGADKVIASPFGDPPEACIGCTACARVCPTDCIPWSQDEQGRHIWERDFEMARCEGCGQPFMTVAEREHLLKTRELDASYYQHCPACKRARSAATFADVVLRTHPGFEPRSMGGSPPPPVVAPTGHSVGRGSGQPGGAR